MNVKIFNGSNLPHELLLTTRQTTKLINAIEDNMSTDIKLSKAQIRRISWSITNDWITTNKNAIKSFAKSVLMALGLTAAASAADAGKQKKILGSGTTTLITSNEEMNDILKIVQALEDSNILLKGVTKTIKNETKKQKGGFLSMLLDTLGASLLSSGKRTVIAGEGIVRGVYGFSIKKSTTSFNKVKRVL